MAAGKRWGLLPLEHQSTAKFSAVAEKSYLGTVLKKKKKTKTNPTKPPKNLCWVLHCQSYCYYHPSPLFQSIWHKALQAAVNLCSVAQTPQYFSGGAGKISLAWSIECPEVEGRAEQAHPVPGRTPPAPSRELFPEGTTALPILKTRQNDLLFKMVKKKIK